MKGDTKVDDSDNLIDSSLRAPRGATGARIDLGDDFYANDGVVPVFRYVSFLTNARTLF